MDKFDRILWDWIIPVAVVVGIILLVLLYNGSI